MLDTKSSIEGVRANQHYVIYDIDDNAMGVVYVGAYLKNTIVVLRVNGMNGDISWKPISKTQAETVIEFGALSELNLISSTKISSRDIPVVLLRFTMPEVT